MRRTVMATVQKASTRVVRRYGNRKLYDVQASQYITLDGIRDLVRRGEDVRVIDNESAEDLTAVTFAQIIYEDAKRQNGALSLPLFRSLIQRGDEAVRELVRGVERGREALDGVREATEKRVQELVGKRKGKRHGLLDDLLQVPQRQLDQLQHRIDTSVRHSVERVTRHPAFQSEIRRVERSIKRLESRLGQLKTTSRTTSRKRKRPK
ncbi:MAG: hypothetical protein A3J75_02225 [Acidobacteria bacterium RBG_16_68_9]|nr:MAG: hypothetical protein A3J75_02225 [Acidobacteria bacterium RBG_16_68_9]